MNIPIPVAERYIGQNHIVEAITEEVDAVRPAGKRCRLIYLEAGGGEGKTFLLRQVPTLLGESVASVARLIDLGDSQNRNGAFLERAIIEGLAANEGQPYRLPRQRVLAQFAGYTTLRTQFDRDRFRLTREAFDQRRQEVRAAFVEALSQLGRERPIILRFDTAELLTSEPPEPELRELLAAAETEASGELHFPSALNLFFEWFGAVIPRLKNVLVLICGRPATADAGRDTLLARCESLPDLPVRRLTMEPLDEAEVADYMGLVRRDTPPELLAEALRLSEGAPLLLASYAWLHEATRHRAFDVSDRAGFERHLINRVLNPVLPQATFAVQVLAYCMYVLAYARRGLARPQLVAFLEAQGLPKPHSQFTPEERAEYSELIANLGRVALIKERPQTGLLFLHDEVHRLIDEFQIADRMGLRFEALRYLLEQAVKEHEEQLRVRGSSAKERADLLIAISRRIYYELELDPLKGYHQYLLAMLRLFDNREAELPLLLRDEFWRWVNLRARNSQKGEYQPRREKLASGDSNPTLPELVGDDLLWLLRYWLARNENMKAVLVGERALEEFLPRRSADEYFHYDLKQTLAHALTLFYNQDAGELGAAQLFREAIETAMRVSDEPPNPNQQFFYDRVDFFLGRAQTLLGYLHRTLLEFEQAVSQYNAGYASYQRYQQRADRREAELYLPVSDLIAQIRINLVYVLARLGQFDEAQRVLAELRSAVRQGNVSKVRQALINNVSSMLEIERNRPEEAEIFAKQARRLAAETGNERVLAQVNAQLGTASTELMKHPPYLLDTAAEEYFHAAIAFFKTANEKTSLCEVYLAYARYLRTLALNERRKPAPDKVRVAAFLNRATNTLTMAKAVVHELNLKSVTLPDIEITIEQAFVLRLQEEPVAAQAQIAGAEELLVAPNLPRRALIVAATLAFERAWLAARGGQVAPMLNELLVALVHCRIYARNDRTLLRFRKIIRENFALFPVPMLEEAQRLLDAAGDALPSTPFRLMIAVPDATMEQAYQAEWPSLWEEEVSFLQNEIEILLTKRE